MNWIIIWNLNEYGLSQCNTNFLHMYLVWCESPQVTSVISPTLAPSTSRTPPPSHHQSSSPSPCSPLADPYPPDPSLLQTPLSPSWVEGEDISQMSQSNWRHLDSGSSWSCPFCPFCCWCLAFSFTFTIFSSSIFSWAFLSFLSKLTCIDKLRRRLWHYVRSCDETIPKALPKIWRPTGSTLLGGG